MTNKTWNKLSIYPRNKGQKEDIADNMEYNHWAKMKVNKQLPEHNMLNFVTHNWIHIQISLMILANSYI
jgi:hypothetical protein